ncbi:type 1 fimbrial protein [Salmonella enterica]|nr:type 1 fimbrial protein [Salmonella enterica]EFS4370621.1 type 1 fimbrial protein [Salmonella enterica]EIL0605925.1 type 1 fimbrial protein [Salmonella enterica]ELP9051053.1 type 1 fimbrial protein [Salmonella enterica]
MKNKNISIRLGLALMASLFSVSVGASVTSDTVFTATIGQPSCSVSIPSNIDLGEINPGNSKHSTPFNIGVNCSGTTPTSLWAKAKNGTISSSDNGTVYIEVDGKVPEPDKATRFNLWSTLPQDMFYHLDLSGAGEHPGGPGFCSGDVTRTCPVKSVLQASKNAEAGNGTVTIIFNLRHE